MGPRTPDGSVSANALRPLAQLLHGRFAEMPLVQLERKEQLIHRVRYERMRNHVKQLEPGAVVSGDEGGPAGGIQGRS